MNDFIPEGHEVILDTHLLEEADDQICAGDRLILRELAARYAELIQRRIEAEKRCLQSMKNDLQWVRPLAICFPETSWREILPQSALLCEGKLARAWEMAFRQLLFTAEMNSDQCLPPAFDLGYAHEGLDWGISQVQHGDLEHGSYVWDAPIQTEEDLALMRPPTMKVDFTATRRRFALAVETFGDLLPVRLKESWFWTTGLTQTLIYLRGLEQMMFDMMDRPAFLHALMERLRDGTLAFLHDLERKHLLTPNWDDAYCGSGGIGMTSELPRADFTGTVRLKDQWALCESQETVGVSPRMFSKFILEYQKPLMACFGRVYYGCCEPVDKRWKPLSEIPNLRRVSVSPWADLKTMTEYLGDRYVFAHKPNPAYLAWDVFPEDQVRASIRETLEITDGTHLEFIMKDVTTVRGEPERVLRWVQICREEIARKYS